MFKKISLALIACLFAASNSFAALDLSTISLDLAPVEIIMGLVVVGLAAMWGFRKIIKLTNRS